MTFSLDRVQTDILAFLDTQFAQPIVDQAIPDIRTVRRNAQGQIEPYIAIQFGDLQDAGTRSMAGVRGDDFFLPIYTQSIASEPAIARKISNKLVNVFLGETFEWAGTVRKRPGGGLWPIVNSNNATECYMQPASFSLVLELANY